MCGRFSFASNKTIIDEEFGIDSGSSVPERYNCAPSQNLAVIAPAAGNGLLYFRWGLIPAFQAGRPVSGFINARAETLTLKPSFRNAFQHRRCLIPADSFYEWKTAVKRKIPYRISPTGRELFGMAGIFETGRSHEGTPVYSFAIITTEASEPMKNIHGRMPLILQKKDYTRWLDGGTHELLALLQPYEGEIRFQQVSDAVNSPRNDHPGLHMPVTLI